VFYHLYILLGFWPEILNRQAADFARNLIRQKADKELIPRPLGRKNLFHLIPRCLRRGSSLKANSDPAANLAGRIFRITFIR